MAYFPDIIPVSDLRQDAATVLKNVKNSKHPLVITQRGRAAAVILSIQAYEKAEQERELLRSLAKGRKEVETEKGVPLDQVLKEADTLLKKTAP